MRFGNKNGPLVTPKEYIERSILETVSGCWLWQRAKQGRGYGVLQVGTKSMQAHRFAYQQLIGPIPVGRFVLHRCDQPLCVNPQHLYLGTDREAVPMVLNKPLLVVFEQEGNLVCHLWPREDDTHASYGLIACDIVRHAARAFKVDEDDVWEWVDKERRKHTTSFSSPS